MSKARGGSKRKAGDFDDSSLDIDDPRSERFDEFNVPIDLFEWADLNELYHQVWESFLVLRQIYYAENWIMPKDPRWLTARLAKYAPDEEVAGALVYEIMSAHRSTVRFAGRVSSSPIAAVIEVVGSMVVQAVSMYAETKHDPEGSNYLSDLFNNSEYTPLGFSLLRKSIAEFKRSHKISQDEFRTLEIEIQRQFATIAVRRSWHGIPGISCRKEAFVNPFVGPTTNQIVPFAASSAGRLFRVVVTYPDGHFESYDDNFYPAKEAAVIAATIEGSSAGRYKAVLKRGVYR